MPSTIGLVDTWRARSRSGTSLVWTLSGRRRLGAARSREPRAEGADQLLDAGIDVGAVEGGDAGVERGDEIVERAPSRSIAPWPPASCQPPRMTREIA